MLTIVKTEQRGVKNASFKHGDLFECEGSIYFACKWQAGSTPMYVANLTNGTLHGVIDFVNKSVVFLNGTLTTEVKE